MSRLQKQDEPRSGKSPRRGMGLDELREKLFEDRAFRVEYDRLRFREEAAKLVKIARQEAGLTQVELATRVKTTQSVIARLESGRGGLPSLDLLDRITRALGFKLTLRVERRNAA